MHYKLNKENSKNELSSYFQAYFDEDAGYIRFGIWHNLYFDFQKQTLRLKQTNKVIKGSRINLMFRCVERL